MPQLPQHTCLGRGTSQLLSVGGSPVALLGCTEADMDFWCWRGRAAETAAEAEAVEARDPGMVRLGDKSSGKAGVRGAGRRLGEEQGQAEAPEPGARRMQGSPGSSSGRRAELRKQRRAGRGGRGGPGLGREPQSRKAHRRQRLQLAGLRGVLGTRRFLSKEQGGAKGVCMGSEEAESGTHSQRR